MASSNRRKVKRLRRLTTISAVVLAGLVASFILLMLIAVSLPDQFDPAVLDDLGPGYEVTAVAPPECGNGGTFFCGQVLTLRHPGTIEQLAEELERLDLDATTTTSLDVSSPGEARLVVDWVVEDPPVWLTIGVVLLPILIVFSAVLSLISLFRFLRESRQPGSEPTLSEETHSLENESPPVRWSDNSSELL